MATFRDMPYHFRGYLYIHKPAVVFKARLNAPDGYIYPTRELVFDDVTVGDWEDIKPGQTVCIGSTEGAYDLGRQRVRDRTINTIYIGWSSLGVHDGEVKLPDNAYITVLDERLVWGRTPYIQLADGAMYKDYDIGFDPETAQPPVANGGPGVCGFVDPDTGVLTVNFTAAGSFAVYPGATVFAYNWNVIDGTITPDPEANGTEEITAEFPPGFRYVELTVTDTEGVLHTTYIPVFAAEPTGEHAPIYDFEVTNNQLTVEGSKISFLVRQNIPTSQYPDGTLVMYWEDEWYGGVKGSLYGYPGREHMKFIGFIHHEPTRVEAGENATLKQVTLDCVDVAGKLATLPGFSQVVNRKASPTTWLEMEEANVDRYLHHLLHWHTTALELTDFYLSDTGDDYAFISFTSDGADFYQQVDGRAQATGTGYRLTSDFQGIMRVLPDPLNQEAGDRTATLQEDVTEDDLISYGYTKQRPARVHWTRSSALVATTAELTLQNVVHSISPGQSPGQGVQSKTLGNRLVISQAENNVFTGNTYERDNAPESFLDFDFAHGGIVIDPALMTWLRATTTGRNAAQRGLVFTNQRFLPHTTTISRNAERGSKTVSTTAEKEVVGNPAATHHPPTANLPAYTDPVEFFGEIVDAVDTGFADGAITPTFAMFSSDGYLIRTGDLTSDPPTWTEDDLMLTGTVTGFSVSAFSPRYLGTGTEVNGWLVTVDTDGVRIYSITDIFGSYATNLLFTSTTIPVAAATIESERITANFVIAAWYDDSGGVYCARSTNGSSFTETLVSAHTMTDNRGSASDPFKAPVLRVVGAGVAYVAAYSVTGAEDPGWGPPTAQANIFKTTDSGATWTNNIGDLGVYLGKSMHIPFHNNINRNKMWYSRTDVSAGHDQNALIYYDGSSENIIAVTAPFSDYHPRLGNKAIATNPTNADHVVMCGADANSGNPTLLKTSNLGDDWVEVTDEEGNDWGSGVGCDVDSADNVYVWGTGGSIGLIRAFGDVITDKSGNISVGGDIVGICGG